jgi:hypothetical protein
MAKKCPPGKYYCFTDKKCKKIPREYRIGARGYLARDTKDDDSETKKMVTEVLTEMGTAGMALEMVTVVLVVMVVAMAVVEWVNR